MIMTSRTSHTTRRAQTTAPVTSRDARDALAAANKRAAESVYGRYATRYVTSMLDRNDSTVAYQGTVTNDLLDAAAYVASVRKRNVYGAVMLYDRVEGRHVTRGDIRKVMEACGIADTSDTEGLRNV